METKTNPTMQGLIFLYDLHTKLFKNVLDGISDKDATNRLNTKANHIAWIAGSMVNLRYVVANSLGVEGKMTSDELFKDHQGIKDGSVYPSLDEFRKDWDRISSELREAIMNVDEEKLEGPADFMPAEEAISLVDGIAHIVDRESYCIGQIGLWRRLLGYEPMKY